MSVLSDVSIFMQTLENYLKLPYQKLMTLQKLVT